MVRRGDFGYFKRSEKEGKEIETLRFTKGHIIGALEMGQNCPERIFTVRCKTSQAVVYNFTE